jgi:predicted DNA-binding transcriptional regulator AlpA
VIQLAPRLDEWMTASQIAESLGITRQSVNRMMNEGRFKTLHRLGERPIFIVSRAEIEAMAASRLPPEEPASA